MTALAFWLLVLSAPFVGSFIGLLSLRIADGRSIFIGQSECDACHVRLHPGELIPVVSWLLQRRRCRSCGIQLSAYYPAIELLSVVPVLWAATLMDGQLLIVTCWLAWLLMALSWTDLLSHRLPNILNLILGLSGLIITFAFDRDHWWDHFLGMAGGYLLLTFVSTTYRFVRRRQGLGQGDIKLAAAIGAWVGWQGIMAAIFWATLLALICVLVSALLKARLRTEEKIPFGPFLSLGGWLVWLYGPLEVTSLISMP